MLPTIGGLQGRMLEEYFGILLLGNEIFKLVRCWNRLEFSLRLRQSASWICFALTELRLRGFAPCRFFLFAYRTRFTPSVRKSATFRKNFLAFTSFHLPLAFSAFRFASACGKSVVQHDRLVFYVIPNSFRDLTNKEWNHKTIKYIMQFFFFPFYQFSWVKTQPKNFKLVRPWNKFRVTMNEKMSFWIYSSSCCRQ